MYQLFGTRAGLRWSHANISGYIWTKYICRVSYTVSNFDLVFWTVCLYRVYQFVQVGSSAIYMLYMYYVFGLLTSTLLVLYYLIRLAFNRYTSIWPFIVINRAFLLMNFVQILIFYILLYSCVVCWASVSLEKGREQRITTRIINISQLHGLFTKSSLCI